jgi:hypothetical protein
MHRSTAFLLLSIALVSVAGCGGLDEDSATLQIRQAFCEGWPYGCTEDTVVEIGDVSETPHGWQVAFKVVDGDDQTAILKAAYLELEEDEWKFMFFEPPFSKQFAEETSRVERDQRELKEHLMDLKAAQRWFTSIYGRFALNLSELDSVSYKAPERTLEMTASEGGDSWRGQAASRYVHCVLEVPSQQLPTCENLVNAPNSGTPSGPLSTAFGENDEG